MAAAADIFQTGRVAYQGFSLEEPVLSVRTGLEPASPKYGIDAGICPAGLQAFAELFDGGTIILDDIEVLSEVLPSR